MNKAKYHISITDDDHFILNGDYSYPMPFVGDCLLEIAALENINMTGTFEAESHMWAYLESLGIKITGIH